MSSPSPDDDKPTADRRQREGVERGRGLFLRELADTPPPRGLSLKRVAVLVVAIAAIIGGGYLVMRPTALSDAAIRQRIIDESIAAYQADGHPCACPFNTMAGGKECGDFSAYRKPGAAAPLCYAKDISDAMVRDWRHRH